MNAGGVIGVTYILWNDMHFMRFGQKLDGIERTHRIMNSF